MIRINLRNAGNITVYNDDILFFMIERKIHFGSKISLKFIENKKFILEAYSFLANFEITSQTLERSIEIKERGGFFSDIIFSIDDDELRVKSNMLYFFNKKNFSKLIWNNIQIGQVSLIRRVEWDGVNLEVQFSTEEEQVKYYTLLCFIISCIAFNI